MTNIFEPHSLSLRKIASWQDSRLHPHNSPPVVRVPSFQRGAVWEPNQVELLWDSLLRGFPIGALVVCKHLGHIQGNKEIPDKEEGVPLFEPTTHHLLDGQQRCNAISLGFIDPFTRDTPCQVLWLDLAGKPKAWSTRSYWVHMTTTAHPWGYQQNDDAGRLGAAAIRKALQEYGWRDRDDPFKVIKEKPIRPPLKESWPLAHI